MYLRRTNKTKMEVSIDEPLNVDWDGNELLLSDILGTDSDVISKDIEDEIDRKMLNKSDGDFIRQRKTYHSAPVWDRRRGKRRKDAERSRRLAGNFTVLYLQAGEEDYPSVEAGDD